jgi:dTDP-4-amino-4,6-dideoxy-D-galactose acyltransferase
LTSDLCQLLTWDSEFFGFNIARVNAHRLTPAEYSPIESWCRDHQIRCLYFLADADDAETIHTAETNGFNFVDIRLTFERKLNDWIAASPNLDIRLCDERDLAALKPIVRAGHTDTRFFFDTRFPRDKAGLLYEIWLEKTFHSPKDAVLVGHTNGQAHSYITCVDDGAGQGSIGLVGVGAAQQGQGIGYSLAQAALDWFAQRHISTVRVVTQGRNLRAQRLYQRNGFITHSLQLWYHRWYG